MWEEEDLARPFVGYDQVAGVLENFETQFRKILRFKSGNFWKKTVIEGNGW
jgi:hypothetical protein